MFILRNCPFLVCPHILHSTAGQPLTEYGHFENNVVVLLSRDFYNWLSLFVSFPAGWWFMSERWNCESFTQKPPKGINTN